MKIEYPLKSIKQWYKGITNLDRYWRERRREEKRLRGRKKTRAPAQRTNTIATVEKV